MPFQTHDAYRASRQQDRENRQKSGPVYDPRTITEPPSTVSQRTEIIRLRKHLNLIRVKPRPKGLLRPGQPIPDTKRDADRLIAQLWRTIEWRLDRLPRDRREQLRIWRDLQARKRQQSLSATVERIEGKYGPGSITTAQRLTDAA